MLTNIEAIILATARTDPKGMATLTGPDSSVFHATAQHLAQSGLGRLSIARSA